MQSYKLKMDLQKENMRLLYGRNSFGEYDDKINNLSMKKELQRQLFQKHHFLYITIYGEGERVDTTF